MCGPVLNTLDDIRESRYQKQNVECNALTTLDAVAMITCLAVGILGLRGAISLSPATSQVLIGSGAVIGFLYLAANSKMLSWVANNKTWSLFALSTISLVGGILGSYGMIAFSKAFSHGLILAGGSMAVIYSLGYFASGAKESLC